MCLYTYREEEIYQKPLCYVVMGTGKSESAMWAGRPRHGRIGVAGKCKGSLLENPLLLSEAKVLFYSGLELTG